MRLLDRIATKLAKRAALGSLRTINPPLSSPDLIDFSSNDYLGIARNAEFSDIVKTAVDRYHHSATTVSVAPNPIQGSSGSRLLTGNSPYYLETEECIAHFHSQKYALLANSGWDLNFGLVQCVSSSETTIVYDEYCHNSLIMGLRCATKAAAIKFRHNDMSHLEEILSQLPNRLETLILVESVYSMDGDMCPIRNLLDIAKRYEGLVVVDEAHSIGVCGAHGEGIIASEKLNNHQNLLGVVYTYGKAMGLHGAALATSHEDLLSYMVNYCSPIIYSTSLSVPSVIAIREAYNYIKLCSAERATLSSLIESFVEHSSKYKLNALNSRSAIQGIVVPGNDNVVRLSRSLKAAGFSCLAIRAPTVPVGGERLRVVVHSYNTADQIKALCGHCHEQLQQNS